MRSLLARKLKIEDQSHFSSRVPMAQAQAQSLAQPLAQSIPQSQFAAVVSEDDDDAFLASLRDDQLDYGLL